MNDSFEQLVNIVKKLRSQEGCPWDREQHLYSIKNHFMEEAYELMEALDNKDVENIREELGDVFFHVIFHAEMADSESLFGLKDVIDEVSEKLIIRHPHVFGDDDIDNSEQVISKWEEIKKKEKAEKNIDQSSALSGIPKGLTPLMRSEKLQNKASKVGFDWEKPEDCLAKVEEEFAEMKEAMENGNTNEIMHEIGDLLFAVVNLGRFYKVSSDEAMRLANERFISRFNYIEKKLAESGKDIEKTSLEEMDKIWNQAKKEGL